MEKQVFVIFSYNKNIFNHIMLNLIDFHKKGYDIGVIFESEACKLISDYENKNNEKYEYIKDNKLIFAVCEVCSQATGAFESAKRQNLPVDDRMGGHPPLEQWVRDDYHLTMI